MRLLVSALVTLATSFAGAFFAFRFNKYLKDFDRIEDQVRAGNRALFTLVRIWNALRQYQKEMVEDYRLREDRWLNFPAGSSLPDDAHVFDIDGLSFLLQSAPSAVQLVFLEADRYEIAKNWIDQRNKLVLSEVFPRLSAARLQIGEARAEAEIKDILGPGIVRQLIVMTDGIITNVDEDVVSSRETFDRLRAALKKAYPKSKFIEFPVEQPRAAQ